MRYGTGKALSTLAHKLGRAMYHWLRTKNVFDINASWLLFKCCLGVDLTEIEGIDVGTALVILAEIGVDVGHFPTVALRQLAGPLPAVEQVSSWGEVHPL